MTYGAGDNIFWPHFSVYPHVLEKLQNFFNVLILVASLVHSIQRCSLIWGAYVPYSEYIRVLFQENWTS